MTVTPHPGKGQVLVAVDGSPASLEALRHGYRMAGLLGDELVGVTVWQPYRHGILPPNSTHPQQAAEQLVAESVDAAFHGLKSPKYTVVTLEGDPVDNLIRLSHGADLLVVGSRGHSGLAAKLLGSVSGPLAAHAHCPVLVVHAPTEVTETDTAHAVAHHGQDTPDPGDRIVVTF